MSQKKAAILETATTLFSKYGYHAVGIDKIVAKSNVAKMTLYKHYPSKEFLIESVLIKRDQDLRESIQAVIDIRRTAKTKLKAIFEWYKEWFLSADFHGCMFIKAVEEFPEVASTIRNASQSFKVWLGKLISSLLKDCGVKSHVEMSDHVLIILDGLTVRENLFKSESKELAMVEWDYVDAMIKSKSVTN